MRLSRWVLGVGWCLYLSWKCTQLKYRHQPMGECAVYTYLDYITRVYMVVDIHFVIHHYNLHSHCFHHTSQNHQSCDMDHWRMQISFLKFKENYTVLYILWIKNTACISVKVYKSDTLSSPQMYIICQRITPYIPQGCQNVSPSQFFISFFDNFRIQYSDKCICCSWVPKGIKLALMVLCISYFTFIQMQMSHFSCINLVRAHALHWVFFQIVHESLISRLVY